MKISAAKPAKALAKKLTRIAMREADPAKRAMVVEAALYDTNASLPSVYRMLRKKGYSLQSALEKAYGAYLSFAKTGLGTEDDDLGPLLDELAEHGTSGGDQASTSTTADRLQQAMDALSVIERGVQVGGQIVDVIYDAVTGDRFEVPTGTPKEEIAFSRMSPAARRILAMGPLSRVASAGSGYSVTAPTSPTTVALMVGGAVLIGYALLGKKRKK